MTFRGSTLITWKHKLISPSLLLTYKTVRDCTSNEPKDTHTGQLSSYKSHCLNRLTVQWQVFSSKSEWKLSYHDHPRPPRPLPHVRHTAIQSHTTGYIPDPRVAPKRSLWWLALQSYASGMENSLCVVKLVTVEKRCCVRRSRKKQPRKGDLSKMLFLKFDKLL